MAWLREVVVVVVAELGVGGVTARAFKLFLFGKVGFHGLEQRWILHSPIPKRVFSFQTLFFFFFQDLRTSEEGNGKKTK